MKNAANSRCNVLGMGFGMKTQVSIQASKQQTQQLGAMLAPKVMKTWS